MNIHDLWKKALAETEIKRPRVQSLMTFRDTQVPYIMLSESSINMGDTVVRRGEVLVEKPTLILPPNNPQFEGFEWDEMDDNADEALVNFLLVRGVNLPSFRYQNQTHVLDIYEGDVDKASEFFLNELQRTENVQTGLLVGPEDCWPLSLLIYICTQVARNAPVDFQKLLEKYRRDSSS